MFDIRFAPTGEVVLAGRFDAAQAEKAQRFLEALSGAQTVDLSGLDYISSLGLGVLLGTQKRLRDAGGGLTFVNVNKHIHDVFRYAGFDHIFEIRPKT